MKGSPEETMLNALNKYVVFAGPLQAGVVVLTFALALGFIGYVAATTIF